jgi:uncharacterized protein (DUF1778 family)
MDERTRGAKPRSLRLEARVSPAQKDLIRRAAELQGRTLADFVAASAEAAARCVVDDAQAIRLDAADSRAFAAALIADREPVPLLKAAAKRYLDTIGR